MGIDGQRYIRKHTAQSAPRRSHSQSAKTGGQSVRDHDQQSAESWAMSDRLQTVSFADPLDTGVLGVALTDVNAETEMKHTAT